MTLRLWMKTASLCAILALSACAAKPTVDAEPATAEAQMTDKAIVAPDGKPMAKDAKMTAVAADAKVAVPDDKMMAKDAKMAAPAADPKMASKDVAAKEMAAKEMAPKDAKMADKAMVDPAKDAMMAPTEITGKIVRFECGDNCYLVIKPKTGAEVSGLCVAETCKPWNDVSAMPKNLIGKTVTVTAGMDKQLDGNGKVVGEFVSFKTVTFAK